MKNQCTLCFKEVDTDKFFQTRDCEYCGNTAYYKDINTAVFVTGIYINGNFAVNQTTSLSLGHRAYDFSAEDLAACYEYREKGIDWMLEKAEKKAQTSKENGIVTGFLITFLSILFSVLITYGVIKYNGGEFIIRNANKEAKNG